MPRPAALVVVAAESEALALVLALALACSIGISSPHEAFVIRLYVGICTCIYLIKTTPEGGGGGHRRPPIFGDSWPSHPTTRNTFLLDCLLLARSRHFLAFLDVPGLVFSFLLASNSPKASNISNKSFKIEPQGLQNRALSSPRRNF